MIKNTTYFFVTLLLSLLLFACASDSNTEDNTALQDITGKLNEDGTAPEISNDQRQVLDAQKEMQTTTTTNPNSKIGPIKKGNFDSFIVGNWTYDVRIDVDMSEPDMSLKGNVLQLHGDMTFQLWSKGKLDQSGSYTYNRDDTKLRLIPEKGQASEWTVQYLNGNAIFVGTPTFGNNMTQIRLLEGIRD
jgi:hypothetical protein